MALNPLTKNDMAQYEISFNIKVAGAPKTRPANSAILPA
jgi:hypothetical protein